MLRSLECIYITRLLKINELLHVSILKIPSLLFILKQVVAQLWTKHRCRDGHVHRIMRLSKSYLIQEAESPLGSGEHV
jgi:hypothetical protein